MESTCGGPCAKDELNTVVIVRHKTKHGALKKRYQINYLYLVEKMNASKNAMK